MKLLYTTDKGYNTVRVHRRNVDHAQLDETCKPPPRVLAIRNSDKPGKITVRACHLSSEEKCCKLVFIQL